MLSPRIIGSHLDRGHLDELFYTGKLKEPSIPDSYREQQTIFSSTKPKTVLLPGSPPEIAYAPAQPRRQFYEGRAGISFTSATGTETKKTVRMDESTENARRIVTVEQTSRVIKFDDERKQPYDFTATDSGTISIPKQQAHYRVPTPKKFVQGQFRESDYESDVDSSKIRSKWTPADSDAEEPCYRRVAPPKSFKSPSTPVRQAHVVSPMEFDTGPLSIQTDHKSADRRIDSCRYQQHIASGKVGKILQPGSPPEFGFITKSDMKKAANRKSIIDLF